MDWCESYYIQTRPYTYIYIYSIYLAEWQIWKSWLARRDDACTCKAQSTMQGMAWGSGGVAWLYIHITWRPSYMHAHMCLTYVGDDGSCMCHEEPDKRAPCLTGEGSTMGTVHALQHCTLLSWRRVHAYACVSISTASQLAPALFKAKKCWLVLHACLHQRRARY